MKQLINIILPQVIILILSLGNVFSQTTIAKQSFESSGDTWVPMILSTPACTNGADIWDFRTTINSISANDGLQFWGIADLNGDCGGSNFESITLPNVDVSLYTSVIFSFDYNVFGFDNGDDLKYELFYDNVAQGEVVVVDGSSNFSTGGWVTETVSIPATVTNVSVVLYAKQNGGSDYGGFDNVFLEGTTTCTPATISSVSPLSGSVGTSVTITASSGDLTGGSVLFNGTVATITSSNSTTIICTVPFGATSGDLTITDSQPCSFTFSTFTVTCGATTEPTTSATNLNFTDIQCEELTFDWGNGDGSNRIVVMSTSAIVGAPTDQTAYTANSVFGTGGVITAGEFVVYNGTSNNVNVTGLTLNTNYFIKVFEYNGTILNCTENYLTSSSLSGSQSTLTVCAATCPQVKSILVNSCGVSSSEGLDEYIVFKNGSSSLAVDDIQVDFPFAGSFCNSGCGTNTLINNAAYISSLNTTATCAKFVYLDPIPANVTVLIFTALTPNYAYDFSSLCSNSEQIVVLFCNSTVSSGRYANNAGANRSTTFTWGTCSQVATFFSSTANTGDDGDFANFDAAGVVSYSNEGTCLAIPLPAQLNYFNANKSTNGVQLNWETWSEVDADYYELLKSSNGVDYELFETVKANEVSNEIIQYKSEDLEPINGMIYYQLKIVNFNGTKETLGNAVFNFSSSEIAISNYENFWKIDHPEIKKGVINIYGLNGVLLNSVLISDNSSIISNMNIPKGMYLLEVKSENKVWTDKVIK